MAGILDSKTRVLDAVLTEIGRRQISSGKLKIEFASLSDASAYYEGGDSGPGPSDATSRIYFEAPGKKKQDLITFETDDSGALLGYPDMESISINGDDLFQKDGKATDINSLKFVSGSSNFASLASGIVTSSIDNFKQMYMIGTTENEFGPANLSREFKLSSDKLSFRILNTHPFPNGPQFSINSIDAIECLFLDKRLSNVDNFKFLPPMVREPVSSPFSVREERIAGLTAQEIVSLDSSSDFGPFLGSYQQIGESENLEYEELRESLDGPGLEYDPENFTARSSVTPPWVDPNSDFSDLGAVSVGYDTSSGDASVDLARERHTVTFDKTSLENNLVMQIFETNSNTLKFTKLDVIDFGEVVTADPAYPMKRVFFIGKVFLNTNKIPTFVNIFTVVLDH